MNREQHIYAIGCLACRKRGYFNQPCQVHHLNLGGKAGQKRRGKKYSIGLCPWHHQGQPIMATESQTRAALGPSLFHESRAFRQEFGTDDVLLSEQNELIKQRMAA